MDNTHRFCVSVSLSQWMTYHHQPLVTCFLSTRNKLAYHTAFVKIQSTLLTNVDSICDNIFIPFFPFKNTFITSQGVEESPKNQMSYLAQKRRSSVTELTAYLQDMLEDGQSDRIVATTPGWLLPYEAGEFLTSGGNGGGGGGRDSGPNSSASGSGTQSRVTFKRNHCDDYEGDGGGYGMNAVAGSGGDGRGGGNVGTSGGNGRDSTAGVFGFSKRARGSPAPTTGGDKSSEGGGEGGGGASADSGPAENCGNPAAARRMSEARRMGTVGATVVQALTCLASGIDDSAGDSSDDNKEFVSSAISRSGAGVGDGEEGGPQGHARSSSSPSSPWGSSKDLAAVDGGAGNGGVGTIGRSEISVKLQELSTDDKGGGESSGGGGGGGGVVSGDGGADVEAERAFPPRRRNSVIADVITNFSIDRAVEQFKLENGAGGGGGDDDCEDRGEGGAQQQQGMRQRASVYVLMHAIAAVDTANDEWDGKEMLEAEETTVSAAI